MDLSSLLRVRHGVTGVPSDQEIDGMLTEAGIVVDEDVPFAGRVREVLVDNHLGLQHGLSRQWRRWLKLHGLAHHLLHAGNQCLLIQNGCHWIVYQQETRADLMAGRILFQHLLDSRQPLAAYELAELGDVPEACCRGWIARLS